MTSKPTIGDKFAYYSLLVFEKPFGLMPTSWMWHIGAGLGYVAHKFAKKRKAIVQVNLRIVHPDFSSEQIDALTREVFRKSFANLASSVNTGFVSRKRIQKITKIKGQENIRNLDSEKGCVMLLFHVGN